MPYVTNNELLLYKKVAEGTLRPTVQMKKIADTSNNNSNALILLINFSTIVWIFFPSFYSIWLYCFWKINKSFILTIDQIARNFQEKKTDHLKIVHPISINDPSYYGKSAFYSSF